MYREMSCLVLWLGAVLADPGGRSSRLPLEGSMEKWKKVCLTDGIGGGGVLHWRLQKHH